MQAFGGPRGLGYEFDFAKYNARPTAYGGRQEEMMGEVKGRIEDEDCDKLGIPRGSFWGETPLESWYPFKCGPPGKIGEAINKEYMEYIQLSDGSKLPEGAVWSNPAARVNGKNQEYQNWKDTPASVSGTGVVYQKPN
jgi:hypothetical protein